jgi:hypothetical protein
MIAPINFLIVRMTYYLLAKNLKLAERTARRATSLAYLDKNELNTIRADLGLSKAILANLPKDRDKRAKSLEEAEIHLRKATTSCRSINLVVLEPDILLTWARIHFIRENIAQAKIHANEALYLANRCEFKLIQADIHNFIAYMAKKENDSLTAKEQATLALEIARCNGSSISYKPAMDTAMEILRNL